MRLLAGIIIGVVLMLIVAVIVIYRAANNMRL